MSHSSLSAFAGTADDYLRYRPACPPEFLSELRARAKTSGSGALLDLARQWLRLRGSLATLGGEPVWRGGERWKRILADVVNAWTDHALGDPNERSWEGPVDQLRAAGLVVDGYEYAVERVWTCDSIVGFMFSTSIASRRVLGHAAGRFEADLRGALLECEPSGRFACAQRFGFTLGRRVE